MHSTSIHDDLVLDVIKWILGEDFLNKKHKYHVNIDIVSRFFESLLYLGELKIGVNQLTHGLFFNDYVEGLDDILRVSKYGILLSLTTDPGGNT